MAFTKGAGETGGPGRPSEVGAAVIAGGKGTRLGGRVKALLEIDGETILSRQLRLLTSVVGAEVLISANEATPFLAAGFRVIPDEVMDAGPLAGLCAVLAASSSPWVLCVASDMPTLARPVLEKIIACRGPGLDAVIPVIDHRPEPLCALYATSALAVLRGRLASGQGSLRRLLDCRELAVRVLTQDELRPLDPTLATFTNVNRPDDLA